MSALIKYEAACRALAEAHSIDEVQDIRDKAEAMRVYAIQSKNIDLEIMASDIRLRGERKLGVLLVEAKGAGQISRGQPRKNCTDEEQFSRIRLEDLGVDRKLSSRAQRLGGIAERAFEAMVARMREGIRKRGSRAALAALSTEEKQERRAGRESDLAERQRALPDKRYGVILADPEWRFEPWSRETGMDRAADNHYPTSITDVIAARPVMEIAAADCVLFLWATVPMLPHALVVMGKWGFDYVSQFAWVKDRVGTGYWNRNKHELLLIGTRGKIPAPAPGTQWDSVIEAPIGKHSEKPEASYQMIEAYFPHVPKIELNARRQRDGWDAWGLEAPDDLPPHDPETGELIEAPDHIGAVTEKVSRGEETAEHSDGGDHVTDPHSSPPPISDDGPVPGAGLQSIVREEAAPSRSPIGAASSEFDDELEIPNFLRRTDGVPPTYRKAT